MQKPSLGYNNLVLEHYRNPRNFGKIAKPTHIAEELNPLCGDEIIVYFSVPGGSASGGKITEIKFEARGCALSIAAASRLSEEIKGKSLPEIKKLDLQDMKKLLRVEVGKAREGCVTLALDAIKKSFNLPS